MTCHRIGLGACAALVLLVHALGAQETPLRPDDRHRLAEVVRLGELLRGRVWTGWPATPSPVLLVTETTEYLIGHPGPTPEFRSLGTDDVIGLEVLARNRVLSPALLATFPAVGGVPTAVVGTPERTGKRSADWVLAVLHEQFHLWQYSQPWYDLGVEGLGLSRGDTTGRWMLEYPFPYEDPSVQAAVTRLASALARGSDGRESAEARAALGRLLTPEQERYLEFQLWQEGVARWVELTAARVAAAAPSPPRAFTALPDYEPYALAAERLERTVRDELASLRLGASRRLAFYPLGAAVAMRLEASDRGWKRRYAERPFTLGRWLIRPSR